MDTKDPLLTNDQSNPKKRKRDESSQSIEEFRTAILVAADRGELLTNDQLIKCDAPLFGEYENILYTKHNLDDKTDKVLRKQQRRIMNKVYARMMRQRKKREDESLRESLKLAWRKNDLLTLKIEQLEAELGLYHECNQTELLNCTVY